MWTPEDRALVGDFGSGQALSDDQYCASAWNSRPEFGVIGVQNPTIP
jgi:hypothetical protein